MKQITDLVLNQKIKSLAAEERSLTKEILLHIAEVDRRKLFLKMAYPSLFEYLTKEIGYSAGAAHRRIDAARLIHKVPEVSASIENGSLHLSQISKVQRICRHIKKESGKTVEVTIQKEILQKIENKNSEQTDLILAQEFNVEIKTAEKKSVQRDESVRVELTFTKEEMELIKKAQALLSNKTGGGLKDTLVEMADKIIKAHAPRTNALAINTPRGKKSTSTVEVKLLRSVTPKLKKEILNRDQSCQFISPQTGKKCNAKHFLEIDHIEPRYLDGPNAPQNLRVLCKSHNMFRYRAML